MPGAPEFIQGAQPSASALQKVANRAFNVYAADNLIGLIELPDALGVYLRTENLDGEVLSQPFGLYDDGSGSVGCRAGRVVHGATGYISVSALAASDSDRKIYLEIVYENDGTKTGTLKATTGAFPASSYTANTYPTTSAGSIATTGSATIIVPIGEVSSGAITQYWLGDVLLPYGLTYQRYAVQGFEYDSVAAEMQAVVVTETIVCGRLYAVSGPSTVTIFDTTTQCPE